MVERKKLRYEKPELLNFGNKDTTFGNGACANGSTARTNCNSGLTATQHHCKTGTSAGNNCFNGITVLSGYCESGGSF